MSQVSESVGTSSTGSTNAVDTSGRSSMSLSLIAWKPRIDEPSKPSPSRIMSSSSVAAGIEKCCQVPGRSQNFTSTTWMFCCRIRSSSLPTSLVWVMRVGGAGCGRSWPWRSRARSEVVDSVRCPCVACERRGIGELRAADRGPGGSRWRGDGFGGLAHRSSGSQGRHSTAEYRAGTVVSRESCRICTNTRIRHVQICRMLSSQLARIAA